MTSELVGLSATMLMPEGVVPPPLRAGVSVCVPRVEVVGGSPPGWWGVARQCADRAAGSASRGPGSGQSRPLARSAPGQALRHWRTAGSRRGSAPGLRASGMSSFAIKSSMVIMSARVAMSTRLFVRVSGMMRGPRWARWPAEACAGRRPRCRLRTGCAGHFGAGRCSCPASAPPAGSDPSIAERSALAICSAWANLSITTLKIAEGDSTSRAVMIFSRRLIFDTVSVTIRLLVGA